jgi:hypothetical protein
MIDNVDDDDIDMVSYTLRLQTFPSLTPAITPSGSASYFKDIGKSKYNIQYYNLLNGHRIVLVNYCTYDNTTSPSTTWNNYIIRWNVKLTTAADASSVDSIVNVTSHL